MGHSAAFARRVVVRRRWPSLLLMRRQPSASGVVIVPRSFSFLLSWGPEERILPDGGGEEIAVVSVDDKEIGRVRVAQMLPAA